MIRLSSRVSMNQFFERSAEVSLNACSTSRPRASPGLEAGGESVRLRLARNDLGTFEKGE